MDCEWRYPFQELTVKAAAYFREESSAVGGLLGYWLTSGQFQPLPQILMELPPDQKQKLYNDVMQALGRLDWTDVAQLIALVMGNATLKQEVASVLISYVAKELGRQVCYQD